MGEAARKDEDTLIPVGPGAEDLQQPNEEQDVRNADARDPGDRGDERLGSRDDEAEPDQRHRETAKERRDRQKRARARERAELDFYRSRNVELEKRVAQIDQRTAQNESAQVEQRITTLQTQIATAERVLAEAVKKQNGDDAAEALRIRDTLRDELSHLNSARQSLTQQRARATEPAPARAPVSAAQPDPQMIAMARRWADDHPWFDLDGGDEDSVIVRAIDEALAADGYDPATQEYWDELSSRVKRRLPERFNGTHADDEDDAPAPRRTPARAPSGPRFSSGGRERPLKKNEVYISKDRKEALIQAGLWDDPVARNRMLKRYAQIDAEISASRQSG